MRPTSRGGKLLDQLETRCIPCTAPWRTEKAYRHGIVELLRFDREGAQRTEADLWEQESARADHPADHSPGGVDDAETVTFE